MAMFDGMYVPFPISHFISLQLLHSSRLKYLTAMKNSYQKQSTGKGNTLAHSFREFGPCLLSPVCMVRMLWLQKTGRGAYYMVE